MPIWIEIVIVALAWGIAAYKFKAAWQERQRYAESITIYFWFFALCVAIGMTFMIEDAHLAFDQLVGVANLAWLVGYVAFSLAIYLITSGCLLILKQPRPRLMAYSLWVTLAILVVVFVFGISSLPEKPDHTIPETFAELVFMQTVYLYVAALCMIPIATFARLYRHERVLPAKLRWLVALGTTVLAAITGLLKVILTALAYQDNATPALSILYPMISVTIITASLLWPMSFLPNGVYLALARPIEYLDKVKALRELKILQNRLNRLCPPVIGDSPSLWRSRDNLDFHLYRALISILDAKKTLSGYVQTTDGLAVLPATAPDIPRQQALAWNQADLEQARSLHWTLQTVNDHSDYPELVQAYRHISHDLQRQMSPLQAQEAA
ncbi:MAG: hypothetical protein HF973_08875 [Chloroflexi bacterium]|nr:hypothetical protein [Chloroflexota bacterium]